MKTLMGLVFLGVLSSLATRGEAAQYHVRHRPPYHRSSTTPSRLEKYSSWPEFSQQWGPLNFEGFFGNLDISPYVDGILGVVGSPFFEDTFSEPEESKGQEIRKPCFNTPSPTCGRKAAPEDSDKPAPLERQSAVHEESPPELSEWERQQIESWETDYRNSQVEWERQQHARKQQFLRHLETQKKARIEQENAQRRLEEQQRAAREERKRIDRQRLEHQRRIEEAERQRDLAEKNLNDLRQGVKGKPDFSTSGNSNPKPISPPGGREVRQQSKDRMEEKELAIKPSEILSLFVSGYKPDEISVKLEGNKVRIQGRHASNNEESGWLVSEFDRTYVLPDSIDISTVRATLNKDAVLKIEGVKSRASAVNRDLTADDIDIEHSSVVTKNDNSVREMRINGPDKYSQNDQGIQHSIHRNTQTEDIEDDGVTIDVVED